MITLIILAGTLAISQGIVDYNLDRGEVGKYEKTYSYVLSGETKAPTSKTFIKQQTPVRVTPKKIIRVPVIKTEDIVPEI